MISLSSYTTNRIELAKPLLIVSGSRGFLACGYINPDTCDRTGEACAIVTGVGSFEEMLSATVVSVSEAARELGVSVGDTGESALGKFV